MEINQLFEKLQEDLITEESDGELTLQGNCIVWTYVLDDDCEEIDINECDDDEDIYNNFESITIDEILEEISTTYIDSINLYLDEIGEIDNWTFSEPDIIDETISFKIF